MEVAHSNRQRLSLRQRRSSFSWGTYRAIVSLLLLATQTQEYCLLFLVRHTNTGLLFAILFLEVPNHCEWVTWLDKLYVVKLYWKHKVLQARHVFHWEELSWYEWRCKISLPCVLLQRLNWRCYVSLYMDLEFKDFHTKYSESSWAGWILLFTQFATFYVYMVVYSVAINVLLY